MKNNILSFFIYTLLAIGIIGVSGLVVTEIQTGNGCPKILSIPMCVVILICFIAPLLSHIYKKWNFLYFFFTGSALLIATIASILQFTNNAECPKDSNGTPMCYFSFLIFFSLILLNIFYVKSSKTKAY
ncbi:hypothetical protein [Tenacibaculum agarivorans]|uniref:hypothetical protein n=1 Tax=Tenacibaculum agarivorans TaxID=1908389 RepID=UPI00094BBB90|nr:hypothetical protein [Tenacibaculum agarivorans]